MAYTLRPYQKRAMEKTHALMRQSVTSIIECGPTGMGKTVLAAALIEEFLRMGARILFVAHRDELITQCCNKLRENGLSYGVIKSGRDGGDLYAKVHVASVQTFNARLRFMRNDYSLIIFDECHHSVANTFKKIIYHCTHDGHPPLVIGLTATPYRTDGKGLGELYQELIDVATVTDLIDQGYLVPPRLFRTETPRELYSLKPQSGDYREEDLERVMNKPLLLGHAVTEYLRLARGMRALGFYVNRAHAKAGCEAFQAAGVPAEYLDGETSSGERAAILHRLHTGKTLYIANCGVLTEGFDEPRIEVIQCLRPTKSRCVWRQIVGRGARPCRDDALWKTHFLLLDHCGWTQEHGHFTDPDIVSLHGGLAKEKPKTITSCPKCGAQLASRPRVCPACGAIMATGPGEDIIGLGDDRVSLVEDSPLFTRFQANERRERPALAYVPSAPNMARIARRSRGL